MAGTTIAAAIGLFSMHQAKKSADKARKVQEEALAEQRKSNEQAVLRQEAEEQRSQQEYNRANRQNVDVTSALDASELSAQQGASGTLLTGSMGVDPSELNLSQNTLLGG